MKKISSPETELPIYTKAAVYWLIIIGVFHLITIPLAFILSAISGWSAIYVGGFTSVAAGLSISGLLLCLKNKLAWIATVAIISIAEIFIAVLFLREMPSSFDETVLMLIILLLILIPLITVILDRKNYFELVRQRELAKKENQTPTIEP